MNEEKINDLAKQCRAGAAKTTLDFLYNDWERRHVVGLSERIDERCKKEGRDTFTIKMLREEKAKMYRGEQ